MKKEKDIIKSFVLIKNLQLLEGENDLKIIKE